jgi:hypothetical protein
VREYLGLSALIPKTVVNCTSKMTNKPFLLEIAVPSEGNHKCSGQVGSARETTDHNVVDTFFEFYPVVPVVTCEVVELDFFDKHGVSNSNSLEKPYLDLVLRAYPRDVLASLSTPFCFGIFVSASARSMGACERDYLILALCLHRQAMFTTS